MIRVIEIWFPLRPTRQRDFILDNPNGTVSMLQASLQNKKGVTVYVKGQTIAMLVTALGSALVEGRSQQFGRIVVKIDSIDAAAIA